MVCLSIRYNVHVIVTAHVIAPDPGAYRPVRTLLTGGKKVAGEIPIYFNEVYHFFVQTSGGIDLNDANIQRRFVAFTQSVGNDLAATAIGAADRIDFTDRHFYTELMNSRQA